MIICHVCGNEIPRNKVFRREVYTGRMQGFSHSLLKRWRWHRRRYLWIRSVCQTCADKIDAAPPPSSIKKWILIGVVVLVLFPFLIGFFGALLIGSQ